MKYFIIITFTTFLIHLASCAVIEADKVITFYEDDYSDDGKSFSLDTDENYKDDDSADKPIYDLDDAENLFKKFVKDFNKEYKDAEDRESHFKNFVKTLKNINRINGDKEYSSTADINLFADFSDAERRSLYGVPTF